jgi:hypothetical protein
MLRVLFHGFLGLLPTTISFKQPSTSAGNSPHFRYHGNRGISGFPARPSIRQTGPGWYAGWLAGRIGAPVEPFHPELFTSKCESPFTFTNPGKT